ncbi:glycine cleavage system protein R [Photobacterium atrarenae]|uniref:Glycine cleavage system transcriptional repressor n=1 Tax=Photobacterium atrarenae TaxID=865757 RepID=A0ABY5GGP7_9GAMM|nr:ACT domain-containing protein [Photobacterium atrarenae]UTV28462.1 transcriptional regulator [Photobacterium atrarenae]
MNVQLTITIAGPDRPQLINQLAAQSHELGGKWLVSKINRLDNQIVGLLKVDIPEASVAKLKEAFSRYPELQPRVLQLPQPVPSVDLVPHKLKIEADDRAGIVNDITHILDDLGAEIVHIENHRVGLPELGKTLFFAEMEIEAPRELNLEQMQEALQQAEEQMRVHLIS